MASLNFEDERIRFSEYYDSNFQLLKAAESSFRALVTVLLSGREDFTTPVVGSRLKSKQECTIIRYVFYLHNKNTFGAILFQVQKANFGRWLGSTGELNSKFSESITNQ